MCTRKIFGSFTWIDHSQDWKKIGSWVLAVFKYNVTVINMLENRIIKKFFKEKDHQLWAYRMCGISYQFQKERLKCVMIKICKGENKETII